MIEHSFSEGFEGFRRGLVYYPLSARARVYRGNPGTPSEPFGREDEPIRMR